jgi:hypothetical protein
LAPFQWCEYSYYSSMIITLAEKLVQLHEFGNKTHGDS